MNFHPCTCDFVGFVIGVSFVLLSIIKELDKLKKNMPVVEEKERKAKGKEKTTPKQRKRMVIEEVESDEESEGDLDLFILTIQLTN